MSLDDYLKAPWATSDLHTAYSSSFLHMRPAPEYATGEVVLASTYRHVGFHKSDISEGVSEGKVPKYGREFQKKIEKGKKEKGSPITGLDPDTWRRIVTGTLRSPKQPVQSAKRFLQISPIVPDASLYSLSARLSSNSWNPGALIARIIQFSEPIESDAQEIWNQLFHALSVDENDDVWARFLQQEFESWRNKETLNAWATPRKLESDAAAVAWHKSGTDIPAGQFKKDFLRILSLKKHLTRRQWISMLESIVRLGAASHTLWVCKVNIECFQLLRNTLAGSAVPDIQEINDSFGLSESFWRYGQHSASTIKELATGFIKARAGINLILHQLDEIDGINLQTDCLSNLESIAELVKMLGQKENREYFNQDRFRGNYQDVIESDQRIVTGRKGTPNNIMEFLRHVLGQRQTNEDGLDSYDQGYYLAKKGNYSSAPWFVSLGPVSVLALVHACTYNAHGPRTIDNLCQHLREYGIEIAPQDVADSMLGKTLRNLGLVLDSPDAEGGMVLINPFMLLASKEVE